MSATPGPWKVEEQERWPFKIYIKSDAETILLIDRAAYGTGQTTLEDCKLAVGFHYDEVAETRKAIADQLATARLIAAAPELLAACEAAEKVIAEGAHVMLHAQLRSAIAKART